MVSAKPKSLSRKSDRQGQRQSDVKWKAKIPVLCDTLKRSSQILENIMDSLFERQLFLPHSGTEAKVRDPGALFDFLCQAFCALSPIPHRRRWHFRENELHQACDTLGKALSASLGEGESEVYMMACLRLANSNLTGWCLI